MEPNNPQQSGFENQPMHQHFGPQNQFGLTPPEKLPNAVGVLVLGILSLLCCGLLGLILAIIALVMGSNAINLYQASPGRYTKESYNMAVAGRICAIIGLLLSILSSGYTILNLINGNNPYEFLN